jgi:vancomycin resistance protein YoaR
MKEPIYQYLRYIRVVAQDVVSMKKSKTIDLLRIPDSEKTKLILEIRRQIQQKALEEKLTRSLLSSNANINCRNGISVSIEDLMQKVIEEQKTQKSYSWLII